MTTRLYRSGMFALYQLAVVIGIAMLPVAVVARHAGITLPIGQTIETLSKACEDVDE